MKTIHYHKTSKRKPVFYEEIMNMLRLSIFAIILTLASANLLPAGTTTQPATQPAKVQSPADVTETFLKGLEEMLTAEEKRDRSRAREVKTELSRYVAEETVNKTAVHYGFGGVDLTAENNLTVRQGMVSAWAAVINYYRGHLDYSRLKTLIPILKTAEKDLMRIVVPATGPAYPNQTSILVICVKERNEWKVKLVGLIPALQAATQPVR
jgi:hypothetical protein